MTSTGEPALPDYRRAERLNHGLYGLVIITATLVAERDHVEEAWDAVAILAGTGLVLLLVHTYTAVMAERTVSRHALGSEGRLNVVSDNLPVVFAVIVPLVLLTLAALEVMDLDVAYNISVVIGVVLLFALGIVEGRRASLSPAMTLLGGLGAAAIGLVAIGVEVFFD